SRQNRNGRGFRVGAGSVGDRNVIAVNLIVGDWIHLIELAVVSVTRVLKLVLGDAPVRHQDGRAILADRDRIWEVPYRNVLHNRLGRGINHRNTVVAVADDIEELAVGAERGTCREGNLRTIDAIKSTRNWWFVAISLHRIEVGIWYVIGNVTAGRGGNRRDYDVTIRTDHTGSRYVEQFHILVSASRNPDRVWSCASRLHSNEKFANRIDLGDDCQAASIDHRQRVATQIDIALERRVPAFALVVIAGDEILPIRRERRAQRVHSNLGNHTGRS